MKKISALLVLTTLVVPAVAEETAVKTVTESAKPTVTTEVKPAVAKADTKVEPVKTEVKKVEAKQEPVTEKVSEYKTKPDIKFPKGLQFGLGASVTSGVNGFVGYANKNFDSFWWKRIGGRFDFGTTAPIKSVINSAIKSQMGDGIELGDENGVTIKDGSITAQHFGALVDFYPFGNTWFLGGWRLTGGYMFGKLGVSAKLTSNTDLPAGSMEFELNGEKYQYTGGQMKGNAAVDWNYAGPYLGTGFDIGLIWGIKIYMDAGAVFTSKTAAASLNVPLKGLEHWNGSSWEAASIDSIAFEENKKEALKEANDELGKIKIFPMVKLGFMYRF